MTAPAARGRAGEEQHGRRWSSLSPEVAADLVVAAAAGDQSAWNRLVDAYAGLIWAITRGFRLESGDAADVTQTTWLRLLENIDRISDPSRVGAWLATTARRESLRVLAQGRRTTALPEEVDVPDASLRSVDDALVAGEDAAAVRRALARLNGRDQLLMRLLMSDPPVPYEEISRRLGMPIGSIGPTRGRCLTKLRTILLEMGAGPSTLDGVHRSLP